MDQHNFNKLLNEASKRLNASPDAMKQSLEKGDVKSLSKLLSKSDKEKLRAVLSNKELMEKLKSTSNPEEIMRILNSK